MPAVSAALALALSACADHPHAFGGNLPRRQMKPRGATRLHPRKQRSGLCAALPGPRSSSA